MAIKSDDSSISKEWGYYVPVDEMQKLLDHAKFSVALLRTAPLPPDNFPKQKTISLFELT